MTEVHTEEEFTSAALDFLQANADPRIEVKTGWGEGSDRINLLSEKTREEEQADLDVAKRWRRTVFDAGFGWITGPPEYGGRGLPAPYERRGPAREGGGRRGAPTY